VNFLHPIPGTPLADRTPMSPLKILSVVALFRLVLPDRIIKLAGGREKNLGQLQSLMFMAGADSCIVGGYLTTSGRPAAEDLALIRALGLEPAPRPGPGGAGESTPHGCQG
jgi:biotin synthase